MNDVLLKNNQRCINYDYYTGQQVLKYDNTIKGKLAIKTSSPIEIVCVHVNGTVTIQLRASVTEQINIHCTILYRKLSTVMEGSVIVGESVVPTKSITQVPISTFLGIPTFHIPLIGYCLLPVCMLLDRQLTDDRF